MADAKRKRAAGVEPEEGDYVRLSPSVEDFMGGKLKCSVLRTTYKSSSIYVRVSHITDRRSTIAVY